MEISLPQFPNSYVDKFTIIEGKILSKFNCIAWAAGDEENFWWPIDKGYWPEQSKRELSMEAFIEMFTLLGYELCDNENFEEEYTKVAIYARQDNIPTHAAKQLPDGRWTSKLGGAFLVEHSINAMADGFYGNVVQFMKKKISDTPNILEQPQ